MGKTHSFLGLENRLEVNIRSLGIQSCESLLVSASKYLRKAEELRWNFAYKWSNLLIKSGTIALKNPSFKMIIKSIIWNIIPYSSEKCPYTFSVNSPYLTLDDTVMKFFDTQKQTELVEEENNHVMSLVDSYVYFMEFAKEREAVPSVIEAELISIIKQLKIKLKEFQKKNDFTKEIKESTIKDFNYNISLCEAGIQATNKIKSILEDIKLRLPIFIKELSSAGFVDTLPFKKSIITLKVI